MRSKQSALFWNRIALSGSFGQPSERGLSLSLQLSLVWWSVLNRLRKQSSFLQDGDAIMSKTTQLLERMMWLWVLILAVSIGQVVLWSLDRSPPFRVDSYTIAPVHRGGTITLNAKVARALDRECSVTLSNSLYDATGARHVIEPPIKFTPKDLAALERKTPGRMMRNLPLPEVVPAGPASLVSSMEYTCNPLQEMLRPIPVQVEFMFEVLP